jgi:hypothetical protein
MNKPKNYVEWREDVLNKFDNRTLVDGSNEHHISPSGLFTLDISEYRGSDDSWSYSRGVVKEAGSSKVIADIKRNYPMFWYCWVKQEQGEYLLCGEDYQGYNVIDLHNTNNSFTFPSGALEGMGFCWADVKPSPDGKILAVEGCYWGCPYELVFVDFSDPMRSPLPELQRFAYLGVTEKWINEGEFRFTLYDDEDENPSSRPIVWSRESAF